MAMFGVGYYYSNSAPATYENLYFLSEKYSTTSNFHNQQQHSEIMSSFHHNDKSFDDELKSPPSESIYPNKIRKSLPISIPMKILDQPKYPSPTTTTTMNNNSPIHYDSGAYSSSTSLSSSSSTSSTSSSSNQFLPYEQHMSNLFQRSNSFHNYNHHNHHNHHQNHW